MFYRENVNILLPIPGIEPATIVLIEAVPLRHDSLIYVITVYINIDTEKEFVRLFHYLELEFFNEHKIIENNFTLPISTIIYYDI